MRLCSIVAIIVFVSSCATYSESVQSANSRAASGETELAIDAFNQKLGVKSAHELPSNLKGERTLLLLERATLLQAIGRHDLSARDMVLVDQHMAWLDIQQTTSDALGQYLYSGNRSLYRSPPVERMMLNVLNMVNFLALQNFSAAKVEARRFQILERFFVGDQNDAITPGILAVGHYLGGIAFEGANDFSNATRSYNRAYHYGIRGDEFERRLIDLMRVSGRTEREFDASLSGLDLLRIRARDLGEMTVGEYRKKNLRGDIIVFVQSGFSPMKTPESIPIEKAEKVANVTGTSGINAINFWSLDRERKGSVDASIVFNGETRALRSSAHVSKEIERSYFSSSAKMMAAAISRATARHVAGSGAQSGTVALVSNRATGNALGFLASTAVKGTMNASDRPDTRSWTTLPAHLFIERIKANPEEKETTVVLKNHGGEERATVQLDGVARPRLINFSKNR